MPPSTISTLQGEEKGGGKKRKKKKKEKEKERRKWGSRLFPSSFKILSTGCHPQRRGGKKRGGKKPNYFKKLYVSP